MPLPEAAPGTLSPWTAGQLSSLCFCSICRREAPRLEAEGLLVLGAFTVRGTGASVSSRALSPPGRKPVLYCPQPTATERFLSQWKCSGVSCSSGPLSSWLVTSASFQAEWVPRSSGAGPGLAVRGHLGFGLTSGGASSPPIAFSVSLSSFAKRHLEGPGQNQRSQSPSLRQTSVSAEAAPFCRSCLRGWSSVSRGSLGPLVSVLRFWLPPPLVS